MGTIAVTGTASGIGAALQKRLRAEGHEVIGVDLYNADVVTDLSNREGRETAVEAILEHCGRQLDGFAAVAGLTHPHPAEQVLAVNYFAVVRMLDGLLDTLADGNQPAAVVASSFVASSESPDPGMVATLLADDEEKALAQSTTMHAGIAYACSKRAVTLAMRQRAPAWAARGVRLNAFAPGGTRTPMTDRVLQDPELGPQLEAMPMPLGRWAEPAEIAAAAAWLLSSEASYVAGAYLAVDGGTDAVTRPESF